MTATLNPPDEVTTSYYVGDQLVDEIAIAETLRGRRVALTTTELFEAVRRATARGMSAAAIAELLGCTERQVCRLRIGRRS